MASMVCGESFANCRAPIKELGVGDALVKVIARPIHHGDIHILSALPQRGPVARDQLSGSRGDISDIPGWTHTEHVQIATIGSGRVCQERTALDLIASRFDRDLRRESWGFTESEKWHPLTQRAVLGGHITSGLTQQPACRQLVHADRLAE